MSLKTNRKLQDNSSNKNTNFAFICIRPSDKVHDTEILVQKVIKYIVQNKFSKGFK